MFSSSPSPNRSQGSTFSLNPFGAFTKSSKPKQMTAEERYQQALVTANVFIEDGRGRVIRATERKNAVANSSYWYYGYAGSNMMLAVAASLALSNRVALLRRYCGWIGLIWGYVGGNMCHNVHTGYLVTGIVRQIDEEIARTESQDKATEGIVPDYMREVKRLKAVRNSLMQQVDSHAQGRHEEGEGHVEGQQEASADDMAYMLVDDYMTRRKALQRK